MRFGGRRAVITGAAGDLGRSLSEALTAEGAAVIALDIDERRGEELMESRLGRDITFHLIDLTDHEAIDAFAAAAGPVDLLVNAAGVLSMAPLGLATPAEWDRVLGVNLRAPFLMTRALAPHFTEGSAVLNFSSAAALKAVPGFAVYSAAKAGLVALTRSLAADLAPRTRVNAVCLGAIDTQQPRKFFARVPGGDAIFAEMGKDNLLGRIGRPQDVIPMCLELLSDSSAYITGSVVVIDAGMTL